jgi:hypothetical protein
MTFSEWLDKNREELLELHRNDYEEALFRAFLAGMDYSYQFFQKPLDIISE